jgi:small acid-soluble spore protein (thioredoxin-like protein)
MGMKGRQSNRSHNVKTSKNNIDRTSQNIEFADELIADTSSMQTRSELAAQNKRREQALDGLYREVKDEGKHHKP